LCVIAIFRNFGEGGRAARSTALACGWQAERDKWRLNFINARCGAWLIFALLELVSTVKLPGALGTAMKYFTLLISKDIIV
jgi:hypothetical protein